MRQSGLVLSRVRGLPGGCIVSKRTEHDYHIQFSSEGFDTARVTSPAHLFSSGRWFYEITIVSLGDKDTCCQFGWADSSFLEDDSASSDEGVGDDANSWAVDGKRQKVWHEANDKTFGREWAEGDVVGIAADLLSVPNRLLFGLNGSWTKPMGIGFKGFAFNERLGPAFSSNGTAILVNFGGRPFVFGPPTDKKWNRTGGEAFKPVAAPVAGDVDLPPPPPSTC
jgi:hypothetical protein